MEQKEINIHGLEKAVNKYTCENYWDFEELTDDQNYDLNEGICDAFIAGANWYHNHVWHGASEEPEHGREILLLCVDGTTVKGFYEGDYFDTAIDIIDYGEKWAYLSDLLPQNV